MKRSEAEGPSDVIDRMRQHSISTKDSCWEYCGHLIKGGYGHISEHGEMKLVHRVSYEKLKGPIPDGMFVLHRCDNRACWNPDHLFLGTHQDNMNDMKSKGRSRNSQGINNNSAKLTEDEVKAIRADKRSSRTIAKDYGLHQTTICDIKRGDLWQNVE